MLFVYSAAAPAVQIPPARSCLFFISLPEQRCFVCTRVLAGHVVKWVAGCREFCSGIRCENGEGDPR